MKTNLKTLTLIAATLLLSLLSTTSFAQANPSEATTQKYRNKPCRDPWISYGFADVTAGTYQVQGFMDLGDCNPANFNGGSWRNYAELYKAIHEYRSATIKALVHYAYHYNPTLQNWSVALKDSAQRDGVLGGYLISQDGSGLRRASAAEIVAQGGGNIVAQGGGNLVNTNGSNYSVFSGAKRYIKLGTNSWLVIK